MVHTGKPALLKPRQEEQDLKVGVGDMTQSVEGLPSLHKALGSIPSTVQNRSRLVILAWEVKAGGSDVQGHP